MAEQRQGMQEQNMVETGNLRENGPQDEFVSANNVIERGQVPQNVPEEKRDEVPAQADGGAIPETVQNGQHVSREGNQLDGRGDLQRGGEQAIYRERET